MKLICAFLLAMASAAAASTASADWPHDRPVELIVGFAAGGGQDIMARSLAPFLEHYLGARVIVINRPGASGEIAYAAVARAPADGYTLGIVSTPGLIALPLQRKTQYDPAALAPVARIVDDATSLVVSADGRFQSLRQFLDDARAHPGVISAGFNGVGTNGDFGAMLVEQSAGVKFNRIPFQGTGQSRPALLGGHVDAIFMGLGEYLEMARDSKARVRLLGYMAAARVPEAGDVPLFKDIGLDLVFSSERGIAAPRGLSPAVAGRLANAIREAVGDPAFAQAARNQSLRVAYLPGEQWAAQMEQLTRKLAAIVRSGDSGKPPS